MSVIRYTHLFKKGGYDVVHCMSAEDFAYATVAAKIRKLPVVWTDHAELKSIMQNNSAIFKGLLGKIVDHRLQFIDRLTTVSSHDKDQIEKITQPPSPIQVVANGVRDTFEKQSSDFAYDFVFDSRVHREKGTFELIYAFEEIKKSHSSATLLIAATSGDVSTINHYIADHSLDGVTVLEHLAQSEHDNALQMAKIYVLPSYMEGMSLGILRAMMMQMPIVTTAVGGNTEILDGTAALLVQPGSVDELAAAMDQLISSKSLRDKLSKKARSYYEKKYSLQQMTESYQDLYGDLAR